LDSSLLNIIVGFLIPLFIIIAFVYWTIKVPFSKRFIPTVILMFLAILVFFVPVILANLDVIDGGFGIAIQSIYFSGFLGVGIFVNSIVAAFIKKDKESNIPL
jgi:hypothetical protein